MKQHEESSLKLSLICLSSWKSLMNVHHIIMHYMCSALPNLL